MISDLLSEDPESARLRGLGLWRQLWSPERPLVLHGAGNIGVRVLRHFRAQGIEPLAFVDVSTEKQGKTIEGLPVLTPTQASVRWGETALFLVTIINRDHCYVTTEAQYHALGVRHIAPVLAYFWAHPTTFLPYYAMSSPELVLHQREEITQAMTAFCDAASQAYLQGYLRWRLHLDFAALAGPCPEQEFFSEDLVSMRGAQCFIDCGAYNGDTLAAFLARTDPVTCEAHLFEPDPFNFKALSLHVSEMPQAVSEHFHLYPMATGAAAGLLRFQGEGTEASSFSEYGNLEVPVVALDDILQNTVPTFIKMDIEGAELEALEGAANLIRKHRPTLAISSYHKPDHPWKVPLVLKRLLPDHHLALRPHAEDGWEWVVYAIPR